MACQTQVIGQDVSEGRAHLSQRFNFLNKTGLNLRLLVQVLLQLLVLQHVRLEGRGDIVDFLSGLSFERFDLFLRASIRLVLPKLIILFLELSVLVCVPLHELLNVSLQVIDSLFFARGQVLTLGLSIAQLLVELTDLCLALLHFINALLLSLEKLVLETGHLGLQVEHLAGHIVS